MLPKNLSKLLSVAALTMLMSGCYNGARVDNMAVGTQQNADFGKYYHNIRVVDAGNSTRRWNSRVSDKNFREALESSLYSNGVINNDDPKYELTADIVQLTSPSMGFNMYVTSAIQYVIRDIRNDKIVVDKTIETRAAASTHDESMLISRKRVADERAMNTNIQEFVNYLRR